MIEEHHEILSQIFKAINTLADDSLQDESQVVEQLVELGLSTINAEKLVALVPLAFGRILLQRMGVQEFSEDLVVESVDKVEITIPLAGEHYYTSALAIAEETFKSGIVSREVYEAILVWCAEVNAANKALNEGIDISGAKLLSPRFFSCLPAEKWQATNWREKD